MSLHFGAGIAVCRGLSTKHIIMLRHIRITGILAAAILSASASTHAALIDLEAPALGALTHQADYNATSGFSSGGAFFNNSYTDFGGGSFSWAGFSLSRETDTTTAGFGNQFSAVAGSGAGGSLQYAVSYVDSFSSAFPPRITLAAGERPVSMQIVNTTYAALSMKNGDSFAKQFGGASGNDPDFFKLTVSGHDSSNQPTGSLDFFLADYRFANNALDYIVTSWTPVDLSSLGASTRALTFDLASSDNGSFGMNTPAYFAVDNITTVPEPHSALLLMLAGTGLAARRRRK